MKLRLTREFLAICERIRATEWSTEEWAEHESDDWFVTDNFEGGYDATEGAFCFSYVAPDLEEYWFQVSLAEVEQVLAGNTKAIDARRAV